MKRLILIKILLVFSLYTNAQQNNYSFKVDGIDNSSGSKILIDILRKEFLINPVFNDSTDTFIVPGTQFISEDELNYKLSHYGYTITEFKKTEHKIENLEIE